MKRLLGLVAVLLLGLPASAQFITPPGVFGGPPTTAQLPFIGIQTGQVGFTSDQGMVQWNGSNWVLFSSASAPSFSTLIAGINNSAAMTCGSGCAISASGTGTITATALASLAGMPTQAGLTLLGNYNSGTGVPSPIYLGTNLSLAGNVLSAASTAATAWSAITGGTNTAAAMVVGSGASLGTSGTGTIAATTVSGLAAPTTAPGNAQLAVCTSPAITSGANTLTMGGCTLFGGTGSTPTFSSADVGKLIAVTGAGASNATLYTTITTPNPSCASGTCTVHLTANAGATITTAQTVLVAWGTSGDGAAINAAMAVDASIGGKTILTKSVYGLETGLTAPTTGTIDFDMNGAIIVSLVPMTAQFTAPAAGAGLIAGYSSRMYGGGMFEGMGLATTNISHGTKGWNFDHFNLRNPTTQNILCNVSQCKGNFFSNIDIDNAQPGSPASLNAANYPTYGVVLTNGRDNHFEHMNVTGATTNGFWFGSSTGQNHGTDLHVYEITGNNASFFEIDSQGQFSALYVDEFGQGLPNNSVIPTGQVGINITTSAVEVVNSYVYAQYSGAGAEKAMIQVAGNQPNVSLIGNSCSGPTLPSLTLGTPVPGILINGTLSTLATIDNNAGCFIQMGTLSGNPQNSYVILGGGSGTNAQGGGFLDTSSTSDTSMGAYTFTPPSFYANNGTLPTYTRGSTLVVPDVAVCAQCTAHGSAEFLGQTWFDGQINVLGGISGAITASNVTSCSACAANGKYYTGNVQVLVGTPTAFYINGASFTSADVGKYIEIPGTGPSGGVLATTIASVTNSQHIVTAAAASTFLSGTPETVFYATDDTTALQAAMNANPFVKLLPGAIYSVSNLTIPQPSNAATTLEFAIVPYGGLVSDASTVVRAESSGDANYLIASAVYASNGGAMQKGWYCANITFDAAANKSSAMIAMQGASLYFQCHWINASNVVGTGAGANKGYGLWATVYTENGTNNPTGNVDNTQFINSSAEQNCGDGLHADGNTGVTNTNAMRDVKLELGAWTYNGSTTYCPTATGGYGMYLGSTEGWQIRGIRTYQNNNCNRGTLCEGGLWLANWGYGSNISGNALEDGAVIDSVSTASPTTSPPNPIFGPNNVITTYLQVNFNGNSAGSSVTSDHNTYYYSSVANPAQGIVQGATTSGMTIFSDGDTFSGPQPFVWLNPSTGSQIVTNRDIVNQALVNQSGACWMSGYVYPSTPASTNSPQTACTDFDVAKTAGSSVTSLTYTITAKVLNVNSTPGPGYDLNGHFDVQSDTGSNTLEEYGADFVAHFSNVYNTTHCAVTSAIPFAQDSAATPTVSSTIQSVISGGCTNGTNTVTTTVTVNLPSTSDAINSTAHLTLHSSNRQVTSLTVN